MMPSYHHDRHHKDGYELAQHLGSGVRHSHRPTRYIINEGKLVIDERTLEDRHSSSSSSSSKSNTVIYNAPGSTMYIERRKDKSHYPECRGCFRRRERCYDGYCSECISLRLDKPRRHETITMNDRRYLEYPERKAIQWR
ncbi:hypothetical protein F4801DRAFT_507353 [Xylaria longipes]|nr:hypothetical protein F4801DRAFT_507353 [Xylaria longipes]RYC60526.1 hypothetical protein CHU98_g5705 [Xylaria longipes]